MSVVCSKLPGCPRKTRRRSAEGVEFHRSLRAAVGAVHGQVDLHEPLHAQAEFRRVQTGNVAFDIPFGFEPLPPSPDLAGR